MGVKMKRSAVAGKVPLITDLELGEIGVNTNDGRMFIKKSVAGVESVVGVGDPTVGATFTAGTNAQGQGAITTDVVIITTAAANPSGVTLPAAVAGSKRVIVANRAANPVNVYPVSGSAIDGLSTNTPLQIATNGIVEFVAVTATLWLSSPGLGFLLGRGNTFSGSNTFSASNSFQANQEILGRLTIADGAATGLGYIILGKSATAANNWHVVSGGDGNFDLYNGGTVGTGLLRLRMDSNGNVVFGNTSFSLWNGSNGSGVQIFNDGGGAFVRTSNPSLQIRRLTTDGTAVIFGRNATDVGSISVTTTATAYNTTSDYRLKENFQPISNAIARLNALPVYRFNFKSEPGRVVDGFKAHEAAAVVPEAVTGAKDAVDADGNPIYQGIDQAKLLPLAWAALQEAVAKIATLEARIEALESAAP